MKKNKGFTLIELLVVIAIIGILSAIVIVNLSSARKKAKDAAVEAELHNMGAQAELYYNNKGNYTAICTDDAKTSDGFGGTAGLLAAVLKSVVVSGATTNTSLAVEGSYNIVTCHGDANTWAVEAPLSASASGTTGGVISHGGDSGDTTTGGTSNAVMWCVDSSGFSSKTSVNLAASATSCQ